MRRKKYGSMAFMPIGRRISRLTRAGSVPGLDDMASGGGGFGDERGRKRGPERARRWLVAALAAVWIALLLFVVAYIAVKGEAAMSELDALDLSAFSASPP